MPRAVTGAKLAEKEGSKTRAILKLLGRGAIALATAAVDLALWVLGALVSVLSFAAALKGATERFTSNFLRHRKAVRQRPRAASRRIGSGEFGRMKIAGMLSRLSARLSSRSPFPALPLPDRADRLRNRKSERRGGVADRHAGNAS